MEYFHEQTPAPADDAMFDLDVPQQEDGDDEPELERPSPLTAAQEGRLRDYLEDQFTELQRQLTRRSLQPDHSEASAPNEPPMDCDTFLRAIQRTARLILYANASASQTEHLLRLTGELLSGLKEFDRPPVTRLLDLVDELDQGWLALLKGKQWTPRESVTATSLSSISQTQRIRLRALCTSFQAAIFEMSRPQLSSRGRDTSSSEEDEELEPVVPQVQQPLHQIVAFPRTLHRLQQDIDRP